MDKTCKIRHLFPGGNTTQGFFSYYDNIISQEEATRIICLKGGPGVGKSTYMKRIGKVMEEKDYRIEYLHCSSDPDSLDGIVLPDIKVAIVDGTSPHVVDPKNPGAVDEIIHLGDYWNEKGIRKNRKQIIQVGSAICKLFNRAYKYLAASKYLYNDILLIQQDAVNKSGVYIEADKIINDILIDKTVSEKVGKIRKLFASAITPKGFVNHLDSVIGCSDKIYKVVGEPGTYTSKLLSIIMDESVRRGFDVEAFYCPIDPVNKLEHLVIKELGVAFITSNDFHNVDVIDSITIDMNKYIDYTILNQYFDVLQYDYRLYKELLNSGIKTIRDAKKSHDYLESLYIPHMDFDKVKENEDKVLERILEYAEELDAKS